ncbi:PLP-dependent aminotransferase family protein [Microbacterium sp. ET2]|uniref:MocR-like transcription factor YczR n=1 Tax=Microbacterium albipurpureum TaxID=3050384 RepID=UPI00259D1216|nr:PLP-dependent aminotransferase family protein [Microbacterium sp. ET2 (Ac-2212)]WJL94926.1 PLP-dependent aminotransferase family protein [Microbacterium sp. ET2 (Ac-2212)]
MSVPATRLSARQLLSMTGSLGAERVAYTELAGRIRLLIADGRIPVDTQLPSERELAVLSGRSRTTIAATYQALRDSGHLVSRQGSGSRATLPHLRDVSRRPNQAVNFAGSIPPPVAGLRELIAETMAELPDITTFPGFDLLGNDGLRQAIADRYTARGLPTVRDQIIVTTGGQHAIALVAQTLVTRSDLALVESPTYPHAYEAFQRAGARMLATPVTTAGWDIPHLVATIQRTRPVAAYLIPDFHNPTGASMAPSDRARVVAAARAAGTTLMIDEATVDLSIDRAWNDGPFARHAARHFGAEGSGIITLGSLSKSIWSGLRVGWIRADESVIRRLVQARPAGDLGTPPIEQLIAERVVRRLDELVLDRQRMLREHRFALHEALQRRLPQWTTPWPDGGLSLWVQLDHPGSSALTSICQARGMSLIAGPKFSIDGSLERFLRIPFTTRVEDLDAGVGMLAAAWEQVGAGSAGSGAAAGVRQPASAL